MYSKGCASACGVHLEAQPLHVAASADGSVAYLPLEGNSLLLFLCVALVCGLMCFWTRTRIERVLSSFLRVRPMESSPRMRTSV